MESLSAQVEGIRQRAESCLSHSGSPQEAKTDILAMAQLGLPLSVRYRHIAAESIITENANGHSRQETLDALARLMKALGILQKYGCNLINPTRPKYWRTVKYNNPVYKATVSNIQGGRDVLHLYGYTHQMPDGLSFPDDITDPDVQKVAAVTVEVIALQMELDFLVTGSHPHPEFFAILPTLQQQEHETEELETPRAVTPESSDGQVEKSYKPPTLPPKPTVLLRRKAPPVPAPRHKQKLNPTPSMPVSPPISTGCDMCGGTPLITCTPCGSLPYCEACDGMVHRHPSKAAHRRERIAPAHREMCTICGVSTVATHCMICSKRLCMECDIRYHSHPDRRGHNRQELNMANPVRTLSVSGTSWPCGYCTTENDGQAVVCVTCDRPRLASPPPPGQEGSVESSISTDWECRSCTVLNSGCSVLCGVCERPRLATRPPPTPAKRSTPKTNRAEVTEGKDGSVSSLQWLCKRCTFANCSSVVVCEMCDLPWEGLPTEDNKPQVPTPLTDLKRQDAMRDEGRALVRHIREGEKRGISPEEVYAALSFSGGSNVDPVDWLQSELPHLLDEICAMVASIQEDTKAEHAGPETNQTGNNGGGSPEPQGGEVRVSKGEAKQAWLAARGNTERAVQQLLRDRRAKMGQLRALGFVDRLQCEEALQASGGDLSGALTHLQRPKLQHFHQHIWTEEPEILIDVNDPDKEHLCRRLLALYDMPSWGRCELALSLLPGGGDEYTLEDVIHAVKQHHDRDFVRRMLQNECNICYSNVPLNKMKSPISCQCTMCSECFKQHFAVAVTDKHIRDMVCPVCDEPDINDPEDLNMYFSALDEQLRHCLEPELYDLFNKKLTEHALMKDPKFVWCCHCTNGFDTDGAQLRVTCQACQRSMCSQCKKPWEDQHEQLTCEQFQAWKRENDPEYQKQGLAGYLRDNGITCPDCGFIYALTRGGCIHFTCTQCRHEFCSGCNSPFRKTGCPVPQCQGNGLHAHHPRDCFFYLRDWEPGRLQALLQKNGVEFNTDTPDGAQTGACGVLEQKDVGQQADTPCGIQTEQGHAGLCNKHYREYLVSLINSHSLDPAPALDQGELLGACKRHHVDLAQEEGEEDEAYQTKLMRKLMEIPLGETIPRKK